jgi:hypothetical protein
VQPRQPGTVSLNEALAVSTDDVGHLEGWLTHFLCFFRDRFTWSGVETSMVSSGLPADRR